YQQNAFIPLSDFRNVLLSHDCTCAVMGEGFYYYAYIVIGAVNAKHACTAHAIQGLEDDIPVFCQKIANQVFLSRNQRGYGILRKLRYRQLFVMIPHGTRAVDDMSPQAFCQLE